MDADFAVVAVTSACAAAVEAAEAVAAMHVGAGAGADQAG